jgi:hypothetical protein
MKSEVGITDTVIAERSMVRAGRKVDVLHRCREAGPHCDASTTREYLNS